MVIHYTYNDDVSQILQKSSVLHFVHKKNVLLNVFSKTLKFPNTMC